MTPKGWRGVTLAEVATVVGGGTPARGQPAFWDGGIPWATPTDITGLRGRWMGRTGSMISEAGLRASSASLLPSGSLLMTSRATIGACAISTIPVATNQGFQNLVPGDETMSEFLYYLVAHRRRDLETLAAGSTFKEISKRSVRSFRIDLPPVPEQRKIAAILSSVDEAIEKTQAVIDQVQVVKKALMQELLTRGLPGRHTKFKKTEIGEIPEGWEVVQLGSVCRDIADGPHFSPKYVPSEVGVPFLSARNVTIDGWSLGDVKHISRKDHEVFCKRARPEIGDVLYTKGGSVGIARVNDLPFEFGIWVHVALLKLRTEKVHPWYLASALNSTPCYQQALLYTHGTSNQDLGLTRMAKIRFPLPPLAEQSDVVSRLRAVDERLARERRSREQLGIVKSALVSVLLTGEVRVQPDPEAA
jgi:type I restriction enzyme S subunit